MFAFNGTVIVSYDAPALAPDSVPLSAWEQSADFSLSFTAWRAMVQADKPAWLHGVRVLAGSLLIGTEADVQVFDRGQAWAGEGRFSYLGEAHLWSISPSSGPAEGGTLVELAVKVPSAFTEASQLRCIFSSVTEKTSATWHAGQETLRCLTPPAAVASLTGRATVTISMAVQGHTLSSGDAVSFIYYLPPTFERLEPEGGPVAGGTDILLLGNHLAGGTGPILCRIAATVRPAHVELRRRVARCLSPPSVEPLIYEVELSLNGQQYHAASTARLTYYEAPTVLSVSPSSGTILGQTAVTIYGSGFLGADDTLFRWGELTTNATRLNATHLICHAPRASAGARDLEVTLNGQQYTADGRTFIHYLDPHVHLLSVSGSKGKQGSWLDPKVTLPEAGYIMVRVWGSGFMGGTDYRCRLNNATADESLAATYDASLDCIKCWSNTWLDGMNSVEVTLNGREYTSDARSLLINQFW